MDLWWKVDSDNSFSVSQYSPEEKTHLLVEGLCKIFPEQVAWRAANGLWYCAGYRVRGKELPVDAAIQWTFLFGPGVMKWTGNAKIDCGEKSLQASFLHPSGTTNSLQNESSCHR